MYKFNSGLYTFPKIQTVWLYHVESYLPINSRIVLVFYNETCLKCNFGRSWKQTSKYHKTLKMGWFVQVYVLIPKIQTVWLYHVWLESYLPINSRIVLVFYNETCLKCNFGRSWKQTSKYHKTLKMGWFVQVYVVRKLFADKLENCLDCRKFKWVGLYVWLYHVWLESYLPINSRIVLVFLQWNMLKMQLWTLLKTNFKISQDTKNVLVCTSLCADSENSNRLALSRLVRKLFADKLENCLSFLQWNMLKMQLWTLLKTNFKISQDTKNGLVCTSLCADSENSNRLALSRLVRKLFADKLENCLSFLQWNMLKMQLWTLLKTNFKISQDTKNGLVCTSLCADSENSNRLALSRLVRKLFADKLENCLSFLQWNMLKMQLWTLLKTNFKISQDTKKWVGLYKFMCWFRKFKPFGSITSG